MAVTGPELHNSKKSKHKKSQSDKSKKNVFSNSNSGNVPEEQDASETDLDKSLFKLPHHSGSVAKLQTTNDVSDSETDIDKPPKNTVVHKSAQNVKSFYNNTQSAVQRSGEDDSDDEQQSMSLLQLRPANISSVKKSNRSTANSSSMSDYNSMSPRSTLKSKVIRKPNVPEISESESESDSEKEPNHHHRSQPQRPQPQPESESEEESEEENAPRKTSRINDGTGSVPQPESESESEEEEEEDEQQQNEQSEESHSRHHQQQQIVTALNPVRIKEEVISNSESSSFEEEEDDPPIQEFQNVPHVPPQESRNISSQSMSMPQHPRGGVINKNRTTDAATFEREHTRISAPVIDIPQDSRVWVLQVPRSIEAVHLYGQHFPKKLKGGEVLNLPRGRWQILEHPYEASRSALNCIVSTGNFCYGMRWLQPRGFWFLKHLRSPLQTETDDAPWSQEISPLPIKELLKMKSNAASSKDQHLKPSKKRHRDSDLDLPSKQTKVIPEGIIHQLFMERKRKVRLFNNTASIVEIEPSMMELSPKKDDAMHKKTKHHRGTSAEEESSNHGGESEKGKKRKRTSDVNEESPNKKKKKNYSSKVDNQSHLEDSRPLSPNVSLTDVNRSMSLTTAEDISFSRKEKKKSKHKEICDAVKEIELPVKVTNVKQEITASDSEGREHSLHNSSGGSSDKKHRKHKKSHVEQEVEDLHLEMKQNESRETAVKEKKKKGKHKSNESVHGETFQAHERKIELTFSPSYVAQGTEKPIKKEKKKHSHQSETSFEEAEIEVRKKKKHKHHQNIVEGEDFVQETKEDIPMKKKKKHKHKASDVPKVKQENFWDQETSLDLNHLYLTQATAEDK